MNLYINVTNGWLLTVSDVIYRVTFLERSHGEESEIVMLYLHFPPALCSSGPPTMKQSLDNRRPVSGSACHIPHAQRASYGDELPRVSGVSALCSSPL